MFLSLHVNHIPLIVLRLHQLTRSPGISLVAPLCILFQELCALFAFKPVYNILRDLSLSPSPSHSPSLYRALSLSRSLSFSLSLSLYLSLSLSLGLSVYLGLSRSRTLSQSLSLPLRLAPPIYLPLLHMHII